MKEKETKDAVYLSQVTLLIFFLLFFGISLIINEFKIVYHIILIILFCSIAYEGRKRNLKLITYLYYFSASCVFIRMIAGVING